MRCTDRYIGTLLSLFTEKVPLQAQCMLIQTKGDKENSYIVHFSDSAMVSRAVARGYVTVNGKEVELTEDTKQQLLKTDKEASAAREKAYQDYVMQYEMAVAKQQSEAWRKAIDGVPDSLRMLLEINNTENVPEYSEKQKSNITMQSRLMIIPVTV